MRSSSRADSTVDQGQGRSLEPDGEEPRPNKLDLAYFTQPQLCPRMVRQKSRRAFELFLYLARCSLDAIGEPVSPTHEELCRSCGINPADPHSQSTMSRLLRALRTRFGVIDFEPSKQRRPQIRIVPATLSENPLSPAHYIYFDEGWNARRRAIFDSLGTRAFAAEYMYLIAQYEAVLARRKHGRPYWFYPLEKISNAYHVSTRFAGVGLRALVELGAMHVTHGQFGITARNNEFGRANRYYFEGLEAVYRRQQVFDRLRQADGQRFELGMALSAELANGATFKNVEGLCDLISTVGEDPVRNAVNRLKVLPRRSLKRRLAYVKAICETT